MPSATTLNINDADTNAHAFAPISVTPARTVLVETASSQTSAGYYQLIAGLDPAKSNRRTNRVNVRFNMPVEHLVDGRYEIAYTARATVDVVLPDGMTAGERGHFAAFLKNALADSTIEGYITDLDPMY